MFWYDDSNFESDTIVNIFDDESEAEYENSQLREWLEEEYCFYEINPDYSDYGSDWW